MTHRERVLRAMRRRTPDRPPLDLNFTPPLREVFEEKADGKTLVEYFDLDTKEVALNPPAQAVDYSHWFEGRSLREGTVFNQWGVAREPAGFHHFTHIVSPLADRPGSDLKDYELPHRTHPDCFVGLAEQAAEIVKSGYAAVGTVGHTYEHAWQIRGYEEFLEDMALNPDPIEDLVERITEQNVTIARELARADVDVLRFGDDVANQKAMMFSPDLWRRFFKGRFKRAIEAAREIKPHILIWYHSDGNIQAIIPELIEIGLDILNPVQPECMDLPRLKSTYGDQLAFWGCIGTQSIMPFGSADEVRAKVRQTIDLMGPGLLVAPTHVLEPEVPWENVLALVETVQAYQYWSA